MLRVLAVLAIASLASSDTLNEKRPELGQYQDDGKCFPLKTSWHMMYRSFKTDPFFGNTAKCARFTGTSPVVNGSTEANIEFSPDGKSGIKIKLISSDGYTHKNVLRVSLKDLEEVSVDVSVAYVDCNVCKVLRHTYISKTACSVLLPTTQLHQPNTVCDFVYDLLCGTKKYQIYDDSCKTQN
ncbi:hypothetical protein HPB47_024808 [Ixodes persulcatus]|uniref:Uncharacterized protein n=1 Tax=Ixodes persulcatus TaxID=34615 RepID=A0AC60Q627_IXOPE|nr:hypothetical protein HPB47_024808 [Ixodes persulcatus]